MNLCIMYAPFQCDFQCLPLHYLMSSLWTNTFFLTQYSWGIEISFKDKLIGDCLYTIIIWLPVVFLNCCHTYMVERMKIDEIKVKEKNGWVGSDLTEKCWPSLHGLSDFVLTDVVIVICPFRGVIHKSFLWSTYLFLFVCQQWHISLISMYVIDWLKERSL